MKSVLRSAFDPVPRPLSPGAQLLLVGVLIVGITISVVEYLESSRPAVLAQDPAVTAPRVATPAAEARPSAAISKSRGSVRTAQLRTSAAEPAPAERGFAGASSEPSAERGAPMSLQPGEDG